MQEIKLKFNSQVCTTREQSQRLLDLGLKPETADMYLFDNMGIHTAGVVGGVENNATLAFRERKIPAWSLHRLMEIYLSHFGNASLIFRNGQNPYDLLISDIEQMIGDGYFNKEYLKQ